MSERDDLRELMARIDRCLTMTERLSSAYDEFLAVDFPGLGKKNTSAMVIAEFMVDYYTCLETCFLRISQHFENHLSSERWHTELLEKMTLSIPDTRIPVITAFTASDLVELMKFRHFRRYYFELEYDWAKIEYLQIIFNRLRLAMPGHLSGFREFLNKVAGTIED
jgi:hypothetical protein